ncbi:uncharacterized protein LAESUDRAFT_765359 [Laetiporus sulphureus 93-53]|uniref:Uncharacterized protein n=1 Tax=Laetiporus sulphureus 93-53 TaxID=1314785 RepID=A0A165AT28_9APHY|nr:uncharacterized protein LAESUDRAFT_765359 [Laetiporus sulphureus 93-53]KZS99603.1 hypothetical protein LAESUDRAFT_765359 [Laetiporus sulphureus 93-53]
MRSPTSSVVIPCRPTRPRPYQPCISFISVSQGVGHGSRTAHRIVRSTSPASLRWGRAATMEDEGHSLRCMRSPLTQMDPAWTITRRDAQEVPGNVSNVSALNTLFASTSRDVWMPRAYRPCRGEVGCADTAIDEVRGETWPDPLQPSFVLICMVFGLHGLTAHANRLQNGP